MRLSIAGRRRNLGLAATLPLALALLILSCGGDDGDEPAGPENGAPDEEARLQKQVQGLFTALEPAVIQAMTLLLTGGGTVEGEQGGTLTVEGSTLTLESFSADGDLVLDGELTVDLLVQPITLEGDLVVQGLEGREGPVDVKVDMTIDSTTSPPAYGGTLTLGEVVYEVAELLAEEEGA